jgi:putative transposase
MDTKSTRWAKYNINYHFVWIPKYRKKILTGEVADKLKEILYNVARRNRLEIKACEIQPDHVHLFVSAPPRYSPSYLINNFKGSSAHWLRAVFPELDKQIKGKLWTRTYYVGTAGTVTTGTIKHYIEECQDTDYEKKKKA